MYIQSVVYLWVILCIGYTQKKISLVGKAGFGWKIAYFLNASSQGLWFLCLTHSSMFIILCNMSCDARTIFSIHWLCVGEELIRIINLHWLIFIDWQTFTFKIGNLRTFFFKKNVNQTTNKKHAKWKIGVITLLTLLGCYWHFSADFILDLTRYWDKSFFFSTFHVRGHS